MANNQLHAGQWKRHFGRRIAEVTIGVIGVGRIEAVLWLQRHLVARVSWSMTSAKSVAVDQLKPEWLIKKQSTVSSIS